MQDVSYSVLQDGIVRKSPVPTFVCNDPASCRYCSRHCRVHQPDGQERKFERNEGVSGGHAAQCQAYRNRRVSHAFPRVLFVAVFGDGFHDFCLRREFLSMDKRRTTQSGVQDTSELVRVVGSWLPRRSGHRTHVFASHGRPVHQTHVFLPMKSIGIGT